eukprot:CAMPEP_0198286138 /NCGR_PEP_ID=MMETSP1449-20131203/5281_1 /TAXON_ID=420275 /ORGANISM="Attheya septentrionalis, Strain CCMP2084" /LENGTH=657 /DNA_ID=CAMNT_0043983783 /DNA_START=2469 /DNA_END=4442 /DNA_ORIENTATION=-
MAIVAYRDNGKSTLINAIVGEEHTEASEDHGTKGIHLFELCHEGDPLLARQSRNENLETIKARNAEDETPGVIKEQDPIKVYLSKEFVPLRGDVKVVIKEYPGLDEDPQYTEDFKKANHDVVICVLDSSVVNRCDPRGERGQPGLLDLIKENMDLNDADSPPVILAINKVDEPDDEDTMNHVDKVMKNIKARFPAAKLNVAPDENNPRDICRHEADTFPIVIPLSAKQAFKHRSMSAKTEEEIRECDMKVLIAYATKGGGLSRHEAEAMEQDVLANSVFELSRDDSDAYKSNLLSTGFPMFLAAVKRCIHGFERQGYIICQQLRRSQAGINVCVTGEYTQKFLENLKEQEFFSNSKVEGEPNFNRYKEFHEEHLKQAEALFVRNPSESSGLVKCFDELLLFRDAVAPLLVKCNENGMPNEKLEMVVKKWIHESIVGLFVTHLDIIVENGVHVDNDHANWGESLSGCYAWNLELLKEAIDDPRVKKLTDGQVDERLRSKYKSIIQECINEGTSGASLPEDDSKLLHWDELPRRIGTFLLQKEDADRKRTITEEVRTFGAGIATGFDDSSKRIVERLDKQNERFNEQQMRSDEQMRELKELKEMVRSMSKFIKEMKRSMPVDCLESSQSQVLAKKLKTTEEPVDMSEGPVEEDDEEEVV